MSASRETSESSERLIRAFLAARRAPDIDTLTGFFADDAVYHNVPVQPIKGIAGIRQIFQAFLTAFKDCSLDIVSLAAAPGLVIAERVDRFVMHNDRRIDLPVTGVFEIRGGKIRRFSDYFDLADFERQSGMKL